MAAFIREEDGEDSAPLMVLEYMQYGDLESFMKSHRLTTSSYLMP